MAVRIGIGLFTGQIPAGSERSFAQEYRDTIELVRLAESVGFDSAWVSEHHGASDGYLPSLLVMCAALAEATSTIRLGTGVLLTPFHDPLRLAEDAAVVDQIAGGRLTLGLGIGWRPEEFRMFGVPMRERLARTVETIAILRQAWTGERFSHRGEVFDLDRVRVTPPPARPGGPPILLGGYVDAALRRAGELGDGHITDADDLVHVRKAVSLMEEGARDAGRDPAAMQLALMANAFVADEHAWEIAAPGVMHQLGAYEAWDRGSRHARARFARCGGQRRARRAPFDRGRHGRRRRTRARADRAVARREGRGRSDRATPLPRHGVRRCRPSRLALR